MELEELAGRAEAVELVRDVGDFEVAVARHRPGARGQPPTINGSEAIRAICKAEPLTRHRRPRRSGRARSRDPGLDRGGERLRQPRVGCRGAAPRRRRRFGAGALRRPGRAAARRTRRLTRRQRQILQLLADGGSTTVAAEELQVSEETVRTHTKNILARLEARNRTHAVAIGLRESLIE